MNYWLFFGAVVAIAIAFLVFVDTADKRRANKHRKYLDKLMENRVFVVPDDLPLIRKEMEDFAGIYIIYNESKDMYYVGQSVHVLQRVSKHFHGYGNGDVYADYKFGDRFVIQFLSLSESGYLCLDTLEKDYIERYNAAECGYNRTKGNSQPDV